MTDHLGSVRRWVEPDGTLIESVAYKSFGLAVVGWTSDSPVGYTGREWTGPSELWRMRARFGTSTIGRLASVDPLGFLSGTSPYVYALNAPTLYADPSGLHPTAQKAIWFASGGMYFRAFGKKKDRESPDAPLPRMAARPRTG